MKSAYNGNQDQANTMMSIQNKISSSDNLTSLYPPEFENKFSKGPTLARYDMISSTIFSFTT